MVIKMDKNIRIQQLLTEKRMSANSTREGNYLRGLYSLIQDYFKSNFVIAEVGSFEGSSTELFSLCCAKV